jgi:hypothetical protein
VRCGRAGGRHHMGVLITETWIHLQVVLDSHVV